MITEDKVSWWHLFYLAVLACIVARPFVSGILHYSGIMNWVLHVDIVTESGVCLPNLLQSTWISRIDNISLLNQLHVQSSYNDFASAEWETQLLVGAGQCYVDISFLGRYFSPSTVRSLQLHNACLEYCDGQFLSHYTIDEFCRNAAGYRVIIPVGDNKKKRAWSGASSWHELANLLRLKWRHIDDKVSVINT